jgi:ribosome assembly protein YihI (activator of Der GTPase)
MDLEYKKEILNEAGIEYEEVEDVEGCSVIIDGNEFVIYNDKDFISIATDAYFAECEDKINELTDSLGISIEYNEMCFNNEVVDDFNFLIKEFDDYVYEYVPYSRVVIMEKEKALDIMRY